MMPTNQDGPIHREGGQGDTPLLRIFSEFSEPFLFLVVNR